MLRKLKRAVAVSFVVALAIPAAAAAQSMVALPDKGKLVDGTVLLKVTYSCPATTSPEDALLWLYSSQARPEGATAGDTAVVITCDGKRRKYRASVWPNIGAEGYIAGTVSVEASIGISGQLARDSAEITVR